MIKTNTITRYLLTLALVAVIFSHGALALENHQSVLNSNRMIVVTYNETDQYRLTTVSPSGFSKLKRPDRLTAPLGSLWKLFVYIFVKANDRFPPVHTCTGTTEEVRFCCQKGESIAMEQALVQSCGPFFKLERLQITQQAWEAFWRTEYGVWYPWLIDTTKIKAETEVPVSELLKVLYQLNRFRSVYQATRNELAKVVIHGTASGNHRFFGSNLRVKTFTWTDPVAEKKYVGGIAGWLNDGSSIWAAGRGSSSEVLKTFSRYLAPLAEKRKIKKVTTCVKVDFFDTYPIAKVTDLTTDRQAPSGLLNGEFLITFRNGNHLRFRSNRDSHLTYSAAKQRIFGRFDINEYVARVLEREVKTEPVEAAKAFAIAIRTYLVQEGQFDGSCYRIKDSTRYQRVSIHPPGKQALRISYWTNGLILEGSHPVQYHSQRSAPNLLSWMFSKKLATDGFHFDEILKVAFRKHSIGIMQPAGEPSCNRHVKAENWIRLKSGQWNRTLASIPGYQLPSHIQVCRIDFGKAFVDMTHGKIYVTGLSGREEKLTIAHEYLHLAFKNHPISMDESFIEKTARKLVYGLGEENETY